MPNMEPHEENKSKIQEIDMKFKKVLGKKGEERIINEVLREGQRVRREVITVV
jgi:hypothetical protein